MSALEDVAAGAEASRRAAWAKFYGVRRALARVVLDELHIAVMADDPSYVWHARGVLDGIAASVPLDELLSDMVALREQPMVGHAFGEAEIGGQLVDFRRGFNVHGIPPRPPADWLWRERRDVHR